MSQTDYKENNCIHFICLKLIVSLITTLLGLDVTGFVALLSACIQDINKGHNAIYFNCLLHCTQLNVLPGEQIHLYNQLAVHQLDTTVTSEAWPSVPSDRSLTHARVLTSQLHIYKTTLSPLAPNPTDSWATRNNYCLLATPRSAPTGLTAHLIPAGLN